MIRAALAIVSAGLAAAPVWAAPTKPLFAADQPLRIDIRGPISDLAKGSRGNRSARAARLVVAGEQTQAIRLTPRGITRLRRETCDFPPLRVEFSQPPAPSSAFAGQRRLKLVTHCRSAPSFQRHVLLEYAAYRLYNLLTPASFGARLAHIDYYDGDDAPPYASRVGFFIEERDDVAARLGLAPAAVGDLVPLARLDPAASARVALFEYMIGNLDWSIRAGPRGEGCCHNSRLLAPRNGSRVAASLVPVPYDFDYSGLVDAPYAVPPDGSDVSVRRRDYQGYCAHNRQAVAAAAEFRSKRAAMLAEIDRIPGLDGRDRRKAADYLQQFFADIATDERLADKVLESCIK